MYRVMIVDDEEPVLESFSYVMGQGVEGFELAAVARSGQEAINLAEELKPDLVFMDIKLQGMDGIEAIRRIQKSLPDTIFILSTAYERFDIAQRAIPLGVFNYLVKPVTRRAMEGEFARVKAQLDERRELRERRSEESRFADRMRSEELRRFLLGIAWASPSQEEWREFSRLFSFKGDHGAVMLIRQASPLPEAELESSYRELARRLQYKCPCLFTTVAGQLMLLFPQSSDATRAMEGAEGLLGPGSGRNYSYGLGPYRHFSALRESYAHAFSQLRGLSGGGTSPGQERLEVRRLREEFLAGDWDQASGRFELYWAETFLGNDFMVAKAKMVSFFSGLLDRLDLDGRQGAGLDISPAEEIAGLTSVKDWQNWADYVLKRLRSVIKDDKDLFLPKPLALAVNHIRDNFAKPLQLAAVAERCEISQGYLSRLFSEYLNTSFVDYLNGLRIQEAARLLRKESKSIKEVAYLVGYADPNYFSRLFRRYMKVAPSELSKGEENEE